jgi:hypothetical protein
MTIRWATSENKRGKHENGTENHESGTVQWKVGCRKKGGVKVT